MTLAHPLLNPVAMSNLFSSLSVLHRALDYHTQRQNLLSSNVANIDTPGFVPQELIRSTESDNRDNLATRVTNAGHVAPRRHTNDYYEFSQKDETTQPGMDGNAVSLEREMSKIAANDVRFETTTRLVRMHLGLLRYAAMDGR